jgi:hypothetical protein
MKVEIGRKPETGAGSLKLTPILASNHSQLERFHFRTTRPATRKTTLLSNKKREH